MNFDSMQQALDYFTAFQARIVAQETELREKIREIQKPLAESIEQYKKETKQVFGIADGENFNLVQLLSAIERFK